MVKASGCLDMSRVVDPKIDVQCLGVALHGPKDGENRFRPHERRE